MNQALAVHLRATAGRTEERMPGNTITGLYREQTELTGPSEFPGMEAILGSRDIVPGEQIESDGIDFTQSTHPKLHARQRRPAKSPARFSFVLAILKPGHKKAGASVTRPGSISMCLDHSRAISPTIETA